MTSFATIEVMASIRIHRADSKDRDFLALIDHLNVYLSEINGEKNSFYTPLNSADSLRHVVVVFVYDQPEGCGAFRPIDEKTVEVKRMFVNPDSRGKGIARAILGELETWAREEGFTTAVLETSKRMIPAVSLYQSSGYNVIPNYGAYVDVEDSVCMQKDLER